MRPLGYFTSPHLPSEKFEFETPGLAERPSFLTFGEMFLQMFLNLPP